MGLISRWEQQDRLYVTWKEEHGKKLRRRRNGRQTDGEVGLLDNPSEV
jgi:hypothetical protein